MLGSVPKPDRGILISLKNAKNRPSSKYGMGRLGGCDALEKGGIGLIERENPKALGRIFEGGTLCL